MAPDWIAQLRNNGPTWIRQFVEHVASAGAFGSARFPSGAVAFGERKAFEPGTESWLHTIYPGLAPQTLGNLNRDFGLGFGNPDVLRVGLRAATGYSGPLPTIPSPVVEFLGCVNGARLFAGHLAICGVRTSYSGTSAENRQPFEIADENIFRRPANLPENLFVLGGYQWDGSLLCATNEEPSIVRMDSDGKRVLNRWKDLPSMILTECKRLEQRFDSVGLLLDPSRATTPDATENT